MIAWKIQAQFSIGPAGQFIESGRPGNNKEKTVRVKVVSDYSHVIKIVLARAVWRGK